MIDVLKAQLGGDYTKVIANFSGTEKTYRQSQKAILQKSNILHYLGDVEIKITPDKGRGVFASKPLNRGDLIVVEKAIALSEEHLGKNITYLSNAFTAGPFDLIRKCAEVYKLKGLDAVRLTYLFDGDKKKDLKVPPLSLFTDNHYKQYMADLPETIKDATIKEILAFNGSKSQTPMRKDNIHHQSANSVLFSFRSFINHNRNQNIKLEYPSSNVVFIFASQNIQKGEELFIDYCDGIEDLNKRNMTLAKYHITELNERG